MCFGLFFSPFEAMSIITKKITVGGMCNLLAPNQLKFWVLILLLGSFSSFVLTIKLKLIKKTVTFATFYVFLLIWMKIGLRAN